VSNPFLAFLYFLISTHISQVQPEPGSDSSVILYLAAGTPAFLSIFLISETDGAVTPQYLGP